MQLSKVDLTQLNSMTGGDTALMAEVLGLFREQSDMWKRLLSVDEASQNFLIGAHTIKGAARGIGAWALADICEEAEAAARIKELSRDEKYVWREQIFNALDDVNTELATVSHDLLIAWLKS